MTATRCRPILEMPQLHTQDGALNGFHSIVVTNFVMVVLLALTMIAQALDPFRVIGIVSCDRAALSKRAEILARIKTKAGNRTQASCATSSVVGSVSLSCIFNDDQIVSRGNFVNRIHVRATAVKMNRHDYFCSRSDCGFNLRGIHRAGTRIDFNEHGYRARITNGSCGRDKSIANGDHFTASKARCKALVPELTPSAYSVPQNLANSASNASTCSPRTKWQLSTTSLIAKSISSLIVKY